MANRFGLEKILDGIKQAKDELPPIIANQAQNYFLNTFRVQGFNGQHWKEVDRRIPGTREYRWPAKPKASSRTNPILVRTGALRRAVSRSVRIATFEKIRLVVDLPYAQAQNSGTKNIPQRQYMGQTVELRRMQFDKIQAYLNKMWKL